MPDVSKSTISLRFQGDDLDPSQMSKALGKEPSIGVKKGGVWVSRKGSKLTAGSGIWILKADAAKPGDLNRQIAALFQCLTDDLAVWRHYAERYTGNIFTGIFLRQQNEGLSISPSVLAAVGARGLELGLDIYAGGDYSQASDEIFGI